MAQQWNSTHGVQMFESIDPVQRAPHLRWSFVKLAPGSTFSAWVAGPIVGNEGHRVGTHKPCRSILTEGKLPCPYCADQMERRFLGYLPLFDINLQQIVVGIGKDYFALAKKIPIHAPVRVKKGRSPTAPIIVEQHAWTELGPFPSGRGKAAQDIRPWLFKLWKDAPLAMHFAAELEHMTGVIESQERPDKHESISIVTPDTEITFTRSKLSQYAKGMRKGKNSPQQEAEVKDSPERNGTH